jgi:hypothetical protein
MLLKGSVRGQSYNQHTYLGCEGRGTIGRGGMVSVRVRVRCIDSDFKQEALNLMKNNGARDLAGAGAKKGLRTEQNRKEKNSGYSQDVLYLFEVRV